MWMTDEPYQYELWRERALDYMGFPSSRWVGRCWLDRGPLFEKGWVLSLGGVEVFVGNAACDSWLVVPASAIVGGGKRDLSKVFMAPLDRNMLEELNRCPILKTLKAHEIGWDDWEEQWPVT